MYYSIDLIKPVFTGIYNAFISDMTTTAKRNYVAYEIKKAFLMLEGFTQHIDNATPDNAKADLKTINDTLVKFQGMFHNISSESELKKDLQAVLDDLQFVKDRFSTIIEEQDLKLIDTLATGLSIETLGGTDKDYEPFAKMRAI